MTEDQVYVRNKYVIHYDFSDTDVDAAVAEFKELCQDINDAGLDVKVRPGDDESLLIFVEAPKQVLSTAIYNLRLKDWLYGVTSTHPDIKLVKCGVDGAFEAEDLLSVYHLVNWPKSKGGAAITPGFGKWKNVKSIFPIHNDEANTALLSHLSRRFFLSKEDLDSIRDMFGAKVAFYFAYMQTYLAFLTFPAITGVYAWLFLPRYSLLYAIITLVGCIVFLEYWKMQEEDLSIRWNVQDVGRAKVNRAQFQYDKEYVDSVGRLHHHFPRWKSVSRQLLQIPFFLLALLCLGVAITVVFALEVLISEVYEGAYKYYLQYLPTVMLAVSIPYVNSFFEGTATALAEYENHRTQDNYEMSLSQKIFILSFIANYLPIFLTAFLYVPMGELLVPYLEDGLRRMLGQKLSQHIGTTAFQHEPDRLRDEVIALTMTGQVSDMFEELIFPFIMHRIRRWYRTFREKRSKTFSFKAISPDDPAERSFLQRIRHQASLPGYDVQTDISEMVIQFGYLALFAPVWPLISIGFLINNWIELRSDFLKISKEHQRPHPTRSDGIGPWITSLDTLALLGSISTGAIVHVFGISLVDTDSMGSNELTYIAGRFSWWSLPVTIFLSEHVFLVLRSVARFLLRGLGSDLARQERKKRYSRRKQRWDEMLNDQPDKAKPATDVADADTSLDHVLKARFGSLQTSHHGAKLIQLLKQSNDDDFLDTKQD